ncbi:cell pole-organizing protein PopZ [Paraburkholderia sp. HC6.4b]|uniref:transglycosylase SLT domain-containing protein n=1 Tax=unclassified Paraburkholderia TaxID=2615204 RepID=UPI00161968B7|nr:MULTISPECIES: transglycosylase SLT domain-containing protein [unclassified Paraburkholderia]MBB5409292.1 cell pole-organizing protein PopZ [Paraburkholderia sp. HC6.4b]MBB5451020.1 cell pole-organizing protein PopZ [Paraburkholderia sp. Kb1A]
MFRKKSFKADDGFGFDADLDIPEFNYREKAKRDDRVPVAKHAKEFVKGGAGGVWEGVRSKSFLNRTLRSALPTGYGQALDRADEAASSIRDLYNASVREVKPIQNELKRAVGKLLPAGGKFLPKSAQDRLKSWAESADTGTTGLSAEAARHASLQATLGDIFSYQAQTQAQQRAEDKAEADILKQIETDRTNSQLGHLNSIRLALQRLADYQDRVTVNYQRKSLEVQLRHYFVAMDALMEQRKQGVATRELLENIQKNTALPDLLKVKMREDWPTLLRNKFMGNAGSWFLGQRSNFMRALTGQIRSSLTSSLRNLVGSAQMGLGMADVGAGMSGMDGIGPSKAEMAGDMAGGLAAQGLASVLGSRIGRTLKGTRVGDFIERHGHTAGHFAQSVPQHLTEFAYSDRLNDTPVVGSAVQWLKNQIIRANAVQTGVHVDNLRNLQEPAPFTHLVRKSITEIIPGFLARIYRELQILRTGDTKVELTSFDWSGNRFRERSLTFKRAFESIVQPRDRQHVQEHAGSLIDDLEKNSGVKLSAEQRQMLIRRLVRDNFANRTGSLKRYSDLWSYAGDEAKHAGTFAQLFQNYASQDREERQKAFHARFAYLGGGIADPREMVQSLINAGMLEFAEDAGIVKDGMIDQNRLIDWYLSGEYTPGVEPGAGDLRGTPGSAGISGVAPMAARRHAPRPIRTFARVPPHRAKATTKTRRAGVVVSQPFTGGARRVVPAIAPAAGVTGIASIQPSAQVQTASMALQEEPMPVQRHGSTAHDVERFLQQKWGRSLQPGAVPAFGAGRRFTPADTAGAVHGPMGAVIDVLREQFREHSSKPLVAKIYETLLVIQKKIEEGLFHVPDVSGIGGRIKGAAGRAASGAAGRLGELGERLKGSRWGKRFSDWTVRDLASAGVDTLRGARQAATSAVRTGWDWMTKSEHLGARMIRGGVDLAKEGGQKGLDYVASLKDVYLPESSEPVLLAWKMRLGHYRDRATGAVIRSYKDIKGDVIDSADNDNVVLQSKDIKRAYAKGRLKAKLISAFGAGRKLIGRAAEFMTGDVFSMAAKTVTKGIALARRGLEYLDPPVDIYVKGETEPRLLAIMMRAGAYRSQLHEDKVILRPGMIDGPVVDYSDRSYPKVVLRKEDLARGLVDAQGHPIRTPLMKLAALVMAPVKGYFKAIRKGAGVLKDLALSPFRGLSDWFNRMMGPDGIVFAGSKTITQRLTEIRDILFERLPKPRKRLVGDQEGTGVITNSWEDLERKRRLADREKPGGAATGEAGGSKGLLAGLGSLLGRLRGRGKRDGEGEDGKDGSGLMGDAQNWLERKLGRWGGGRLLKGAMKGVKRAGRGLGALAGGGRKLLGRGIGSVLGRTALTGGAEALAGEGLAAAGATGTLGLGGSLAGMGGLAGGLATAGEVIGGGLAAVGSFLSLPVVLGAAAVAGAGYLAYRGIRRLLEKKPGALASVRIAQYGFLPDDHDSVKAILTLEDTLMKGVYYRNGRADVSGKSINFREIVAPFDIDPANRGEVANFATWYLRRFKPVFCTHLTVLKSMGQNISLPEVDERLRRKEDRQQYLKAVSWPTGPYKEMRSPFHGSILTLHRSLTLDAGPKEVATYVAAAQAAIDSMRADQPSTGKAAALKVGAAAASSVATEAGKAAADQKKKADAAQRLQTARDVTPASTPARDQGKGWTDLLTDRIQSGVGTVGSLMAGMWDSVKDVAGNLISGVESAAAGGASRAWDVAKRAGTAVGTMAGKVVSGVKETVAGVAGAAGGAIRTGLQALGGRIGQLPLPIGRGWSAVKDLIGKAASMVGVDPILLAAIGAIESAFNPSAKAGTSSASGLFQFINSTWQTMLRKYGSKYDIPPNTPQTDPRASALMGAEFIKENVAALKGVKATITPTDVYLAHFLGPGGAKQLLKADPGTDAVALMPGPAAANRSIFFNRDGSHRSVAGVYAEIGRRVQLGLKQTGVTTGAVDVASAPVKTGKGAGVADTAIKAPAPGASGVGANATNAPADAGPAKPASPASAKAPSPATGAAAIAPTTPGMTGVGGAGSATAASAAGPATASKSATAGAMIPVTNTSQGDPLSVVPRQPAVAAAVTLADASVARTRLAGAISNVPSKIPFAGGSPAAPFAQFGFGPGSVKLIDQGPKSLMTIQQAQHDEHMDALGGVGETLDRSLKVHEQALDVLKAMYDLMQQAVKQGARSGAGNLAAGANAAAASTVQSLPSTSRPMPTAPVSMAKMA